MDEAVAAVGDAAVAGGGAGGGAPSPRASDSKSAAAGQLSADGDPDVAASPRGRIEDGDEVGEEGLPAPRKLQRLQADGWAKLVATGPSLTAVVRAVGVRGLRVDQWYNARVPEATGGSVHALILLYKWRVDRGDAFKWNASHAVGHANAETSGGGRGDVMFANQIVNSGSVTQAVVAALLNLPAEVEANSDVRLGDEVAVLREYARPLTPVVRGAAVNSSSAVREAHNAAALSQPSPPPSEAPPEIALSELFWLYTVYVPGQSRRWIYELDGCAQDAVALGGTGATDEDDADPRKNEWVRVVTDPLEARVKELRQHRVPFELYALVDDRPPRLLADSAAAADEVAKVEEGESVRVNGQNGLSPKAEDALTPGASPEHVGGELPNGGAGVAVQRKMSADEALVRERQILTHNYDTFLVEMLKLMASKGQLNALISGACKRNNPDENEEEEGGEEGEEGEEEEAEGDDGDGDMEESDDGGATSSDD